MQKFREVIQAYNVCMSFVKGIHNHISDTLLRSPVGGPEGIERTLRRLRLRRHTSYASCVTGDTCMEVIEDPALDEMWEAAKLDERYQSVAEAIQKKADKVVYKSVSKAAIRVQQVWSGEDVGD